MSAPLRQVPPVDPWETVEDLLAGEVEAVRWCVPGLVAYGTSTLLIGRVKAAGKSTLALHMARAKIHGSPFVGGIEPCESTPAVMLSEMPRPALRLALQGAGYMPGEALHVIRWAKVARLPWSAVVDLARRKVEGEGAGLLIVDTWGRWCGLGDEDESKAGKVLEKFSPLRLIAEELDIGLLLIAHERKSGGSIEDAGRGSSALAGEVDILLRLARTAGQGADPTVRCLEGLGRFDETPDKLMIELEGGHYRALGDRADVAQKRAEDALRRKLAAGPPGDTPDVLAKDLGLPRTSCDRGLDALERRGEAQREGRGVKGDPYRWFRPIPEVDS